MNSESAVPAAPWIRTPWFLTSPPDTPDDTLERPRLIRHLDAALAADGVATVAAPSGYGKTVLLTAWAARHPEPTAWLTLTHHDRDDESLLLTGVLSALAPLAGRVPETGHVHADLAVATPPRPRDVVTAIARTVATIGTPVVMIVDDAHHAGPRVAEDVVDVVTRVTQGRLRFVVAGSPEILPWFARRAARHPEITLTATQLAMTPDEIAAAATSHGITVDAEVAAALHRTTGGWPIALHLCHFVAQGDSASPIRNDALLADYIAATVLPLLRPRLRDFVLAATTCDRLDAVLAEALGADPDSGSLLEECATAGFLVRHVDGTGHVLYRWLDVFADVCRRIVARRSTARSNALQAVAARAIAPYSPSEALVHATRSGDPTLIADIVGTMWMRILVDSGARTLNTCCVGLPSPIAQTAEVLVIRACCVNLLGDRVGARLLADAASARDDGDERFLITNAFAQLFLTDDQDRLASTADTVQRLLEQGRTDPAHHPYGLFLLAWTRLRLRRDPVAAIGLLRSAMDAAEVAGHTVLARRARANLLFALVYGGRFTAAQRVLADGFTANLETTDLETTDPETTTDLETTTDDWFRYDGGIGQFALGYGAFWRGQTDAAQTHFRSLLAAGADAASYGGLARVYLAIIGAAGTPDAIHAARRLLADIPDEEVHGMPWPAYRAIAEAELLAASGRLDEAVDVVQTLADQRHVPVVRIVSADIARRGGHLGLAMDLLAEVGVAARAISYVGVSADVTAALVAHERGDVGNAHRYLERALEVAAGERVIAPFRSGESRLRALLADHTIAGTGQPEFLAARVADLASTEDEPLAGSPLSRREREIYAYLRTSMTAGEIAAALFVSVNTVRTHQRAIYRKLGVTSRRDAVNLRR
ncbi:LuxR C-terminal-related transcriptional regulator [Gordonia sp. NPDC003376]